MWTIPPILQPSGSAIISVLRLSRLNRWSRRRRIFPSLKKGGELRILFYRPALSPIENFAHQNPALYKNWGVFGIDQDSWIECVIACEDASGSESLFISCCLHCLLDQSTSAAVDRISG